MPTTVAPPIETHHPATFRNRGIAAPFITPLLAGARVRDSDRLGKELVVPNPSGGRGVYILHWPSVCALCKPGVHDTVLFRRFTTLKVIDSAGVRTAALEVATEGHAGRGAAIAAEAALAADRAERLLAHFLMLIGLVERLDPKGHKSSSLPERTLELDRRANAVLHRLSASIGRPVAQLAGGIAALADAFSPLGVAQDDRIARIPRLIFRLEEAGSTLSHWLSEAPENDVGGLGQTIATAMRAICETATTVLRTTRLKLTDPLALLQNWCAEPTGIVALTGRCDALLDGWERVALLWLSATTTALRRAVLLETIPLMPVLPREAMDWKGVPISPESMEPACRVTCQQDSWRTGGAAFSLVERNEKLRAMSF